VPTWIPIRDGRLRIWVFVLLFLAVACAFLIWEPWHGPVVLPLARDHGVDAGDLPALAPVAIAVGLWRVRARRLRRR